MAPLTTILKLNPPPNDHYTPPPPKLLLHVIITIIIIILTSSSSHMTLTHALNITDILSHYPDLSDFTSLLTSSAVASAVDLRTSLTILAVPNSLLRRSSSSLSLSPAALPDVIRYHVLLQYLTWSDLRRIPPSGSLFSTLLQTTGRAPALLGSLNATFNPSDGVVSFHPPNNSTVSATVISVVKTVPYDLSIFTVDSLLFPCDFDLTASETRQQPPQVNITTALINGHNFNVVTSMLVASGVVSEFEEDEEGAGITIFVPTDVAFSNLPSTVNLQELPAEHKSLVLKFHVLHSYYPLGSLESIVNPGQPTLATEDYGAGSFTLNISRVNGSVSINSGIVVAGVTQTVFDEKPVAIFGVSSVLLPKEIFGRESEVIVGGGAGGGGGGGGPLVAAQPPYIGPEPVSEPDGPMPSVSIGHGKGVVSLLCIGGLLLCGLL
ncbi:hypothetical protein vseg_010072 [Gypsophila vaccaria]